jgi:uncharacterized protein YjbJ (UPF0337 family)
LIKKDFPGVDNKYTIEGRTIKKEELQMNKDIIEGKWEQLKGGVQKNWGKLTDDDLDVIKGDAKILAGKVQERYGITKEEAEEQVKNYKWE